MSTRARSILLVLLLGAAASVILCLGLVGPCWSRWALDGILVDRCPQGDVRPVAYVVGHELGRGDWGKVQVGVTAHYLAPHGPATTPVRRFSVDLVAVDPTGKETPLEPKKGWDDAGWVEAADADAPTSEWKEAMVKLPDGPDGDWTIRAVVDSRAGESTAEMTLPLYVPAFTHVLTDSPLYKPGQTMRFRAVLLAEGDLTPLSGRPGTWRVTSPEGDVVLEEKAKTSRMGVVSASFPLDAGAPGGPWRVRFDSGSSSDEVTVEVREFQLPRFTVEARSERAWWGKGERPVVSGTVRYTSGAPVAESPVSVSAGARSGEWPPPPSWLTARTVTTDRDGRFRFELDPVPADLQGIASVGYALTATEPAGAVANGAAKVMVSADAIDVSAVTELAGGLVPDSNYRVYLRVTTPDGVPLRGTSVRIRKEWDPDDPGIVAEADADGVARLQLDPGQPTTVVVPAMPVRPEPRTTEPRVSIDGGADALTGDALDVASRVVVDRWAAAMERCAVRTRPGATANVSLAARIGPGGEVRSAAARDNGDETPLSRCLGGVARGERGPAGVDRLWKLDLRVRDPEAPWVQGSVSPVLGDASGLAERVEEALREARSCVAGVTESLDAPTIWVWELTAGSRAVALSTVPNRDTSGQLGGAETACVARSLAGLTLEEPAEAGATGTLELSVSVPASFHPPTPEPTTWPGFALRVTALRGQDELGSTVLRMRPGEVPPLRLRFSEVIVDPGATVELTALRGPGAAYTFPKKMTLYQADRKLLDFDFDPDKRVGRFTLPSEVHGFVQVSWQDARALLYVRSPADLAVKVAADKEVYRPGETATLTVETRDGVGPVEAGVTLSGVDSTLAALAALPAADEFARVTVRATTPDPAFGVLDARALQTGQIAGENAAQAAVLRVAELPATPPGAARASGRGRAAFDRNAEVTDAFYTLYTDVRASVRTWERSAPAGEGMTPKKMVEIWEATLREHPAKDPFGNQLHLSLVPRDLLPLTDPRVLVSDGARLPEDVEDWARYVEREAP